MQKIVLTGGACAGKNTSINIIKDKYGDKIIVVPEAATSILSGGFYRKTNVIKKYLEKEFSKSFNRFAAC